MDKKAALLFPTLYSHKGKEKLAPFSLGGKGGDRGILKAFTLTELIVIVTILAILGLISFISIQGFATDARDAKRVSDVRSLITKITIENGRGIDYKDIMNSNPKSNSLTINGEEGKEGFQNTGNPINWNILRENGDNFKDPSTGNPYPFAFAEGNAGGVGYSFIQLAYTEEKTGKTKLLGNYYEMQPGDSPSLFTNEGGNGERIPNDYIIDDDIQTPPNDCERNPDFNGYDVPAINDGETTTAIRTETIDNGQVNYSQDFTCNDGNFETSGTEQTLIPNCYTTYIPQGTTCVKDECAGNIPDNAESNALSQSYGTSWIYNIQPGVCTYKCAETFHTENDGISCISDEEIGTCTGNIPTQATKITEDTYTRTWTTTRDKPVTTARSNGGSICGYSCNSGWSGDDCSIASSYTITIDENGGGAVSDLSYTTSTSQQTKTLTPPTRTGYTFKDWTITTQATGGIATITDNTLTLPANIYGNITIKANWNVVSYTISYSANNGTLSGCIPTGYTIESAVITPSCTKKTRNGYTFSSFSPTSITAGSIGNKTFTANWSANSYTITIDENGGGAVSDLSYSTSTSQQTITLTKPTKSNSTFSSWSISADTSGSNSSISGNTLIIPINAYGNITIKANYTCNSGYTLDTSTNTCKENTPTVVGGGTSENCNSKYRYHPPTGTATTFTWGPTGSSVCGNGECYNANTLNSTIANNISNYPAFQACVNLGNGWRLPTKAELISLSSNNSSCSSLSQGFNLYRSSTAYDSNRARRLFVSIGYANSGLKDSSDVYVVCVHD